MPDVTVCDVESWLVHVTVSPTLISIGLGAKAVSVKLDEPDVMSAVTVAVEFCEVASANKADGGLLLENIATEAIETPTTTTRQR